MYVSYLTNSASLLIQYRKFYVKAKIHYGSIKHKGCGVVLVYEGDMRYELTSIYYGYRRSP